MGELYFITGNAGKFNQAKSIIPKVKQIDIDLLEIQELDNEKIIEEKLNEASKKIKGDFFCEDTSLEIDGLKGLPGPFIKWFLKTIGKEGVAKMALDSKNNKAIAKSTIGYSSNGKVFFIEAETRGEVVFPRGTSGFGWDPIFQPENTKKTLGEMTLEEKMPYSPRAKALIKLKDYLN